MRLRIPRTGSADRERTGGIDGPFVARGIAIGVVAVVGLGYLVVHLALSSPALGFDGRLYAAAARAWLQGGDPWAVQIEGLALAAPPTVLPMAAPLALLPTALVGPVSIVLAGIFAVIAVRLARVGWWWLLSIPVLEGVLVGSLDMPAIALIVWTLDGSTSSSRLIGAAGAMFAKLYAVVPAVLIGRRSVAVTSVLVVVVSAPFLPWAEYVHRLPELTARLVEQAGNGVGSPWATPWLVPPTIAALVALGRRDGAWLMVPALWPATQVHYSVFMLPVGSPVLALVFLAPVPAPAAVAVIALAIVRGFQGRLDPWSWVPDRPQ